MIDLYRGLSAALHEGWAYGPFVARLVVGLMFAFSGFSKLTNAKHHEEMVATLRKAGIPSPRAQGWFVAACELLFGAMLAAGLLTLVSVVVLAIISIVAMLTVSGKAIKGMALAYRVSSLLYTPESLLLALLIGVILTGPGALALDTRLGLAPA